MKLEKLILENFRGYHLRTEISFENFTVLIGKNDAGKSTLLEALNIFFGNSNPDQGDACIFGDRTKVRIACVFSDFPEQIIIDATNPTSLKDEYLLNTDGLLEIHKIFNCTKAKITEPDEIYAIAKTPLNCSDLLILTNAKLKEKAKKLKVDLSNVDETVNAQLRESIRKHYFDGNYESVEIPLKKEPGKAIWESLEKYMPLFAIFKSDRTSTDQDDEAQDPLKAAIREAIKEQEKQLEIM